MDPLQASADTWTPDIELILRALRDNSDRLQAENKKHIFLIERRLMYFRLPTIILSSVNSVFSVGLSAYLEQGTVSVINCLLSLVIACISSVELYLQLSKKLEQRMASYHHFKLLSLKLAATIKLEPANRDGHAAQFLSTVKAEYRSGVEQALVLRHRLDDRLVADSRGP